MQQLITQLLNEVQYMQDKYELVKESNTDYDFYTEVIPFTENIDKSLSKLRSFETQILSLQYMNKRKFDLLISNIEALSVECHFKRTSRKLFTEKLKQYNMI